MLSGLAALLPPLVITVALGAVGFWLLRLDRRAERRARRQASRRE